MTQTQTSIIRHLTLSPATPAQLFFCTDINADFKTITDYLTKLLSTGYAEFDDRVYTLR